MIRGFRVVEAPSGRKRLLTFKVFKKWTNEEVEDFDHDIFDPKAWKKYLENFRTPSGKKLPRYTADGEPIAYQVYFWGAPRWIKEHFNTQHESNSYASLFPGNDKNGEKLEIAEYGILR